MSLKFTEDSLKEPIKYPKRNIIQIMYDIVCCIGSIAICIFIVIIVKWED